MKRTVYGHLIGGLCLLSFAELAVVTKLWFPEVYLLEWTCRHSYIYMPNTTIFTAGRWSATSPGLESLFCRFR